MSKQNYDLTIVIGPGEEISVAFFYNSTVYQDSTIERVKRHYDQLIKQIANKDEGAIKDLGLLSTGERERILSFNATHESYVSGKTVLDLFEGQVTRFPEQESVRYLGKSLSYRELAKVSESLAVQLQGLGVGKNKVVGILQEPSDLLMISIMGVLKSGGAFLLIDPSYPSMRKRHMIEHSGVEVILSVQGLIQANQEILVGLTPEKILDLAQVDFRGEKKEGELAPVLSDSLAYVLYTSGSTGMPKGAKVSHGSLFNYLSWSREVYMKGEESSMCLFSSISFDLTLSTLFLPLVSGSTLHVYDRAEPSELLSRVLSEGYARVLKLTPSHLRLIKELEVDLSSVECLIVGGEQLDTDLALEIQKRGKMGLSIYNEYGPTEATIGCTLHLFRAEEASKRNHVLIGRPTANNEIYLLDSHMGLQAQGVVGEIYIGGSQVFEGYLSLTGEGTSSLVANPYKSGGQLYKTGDLARWLPTGELEFLGRRDDQVKVRGYRIELGEIEVQLSGYEGISQAIVGVKDHEGQSILVAYYVSPEEIALEDLQEYISPRLPGYMLPSHYIRIDHIPLTANGKVDRRALPDWNYLSERAFVAPSNEIEVSLVEIWGEVLNVDKEAISVQASFFELGGNSITAVRLIGKVNKQFNVNLKLSDFYDKNQIDHLANHILVVKQVAISRSEQEELIELNL